MNKIQIKDIVPVALVLFAAALTSLVGLARSIYALIAEVILPLF
jgi:hypothetical protein